MTRSHALLHCTNDNLRAARAEASEGKKTRGASGHSSITRGGRAPATLPGAIGGGKVGGGGRCRRNPGREDGRVDCVGGGGEGRPVGHCISVPFFSFLPFFHYREPHPSSSAHHARWGRRIFLVRRWDIGRFLLLFLYAQYVYISLRDEGRINETIIIVILPRETSARRCLVICTGSP